MAMYKKKVYKKKVVKSKRRPKVGLATVKSIVKRAVARNIENKTYSTYFSNQPIYPSTHVNFQSSINPVSPFSGYMNIVQGITQGTRIGNTIKIKALNFKYVLCPTPYNPVTNSQPSPTEVILWIFYDKSNPVNLPTMGSDFLQLGGSATPLQNSLIDCTAPINTDRYKVVYRKIHKLGYSTFSGSGGNPSAGNYANNDYKISIKGSVNLMPYIVKNVKFNDNNPTPTTRGLFAVFQAVRSVNSNYTSDQIPCMAIITSDMHYEDA